MQLLAAASDCGMNSTTINASYNDNRTLVIPVVFHVIKKTDGTGAITPALLQSQIDILNEDFNAMPGTTGAMGNEREAPVRAREARSDRAIRRPASTSSRTTRTSPIPAAAVTNAMKRALKLGSDAATSTSTRTTPAAAASSATRRSRRRKPARRTTASSRTGSTSAATHPVARRTTSAAPRPTRSATTSASTTRSRAAAAPPARRTPAATSSATPRARRRRTTAAPRSRRAAAATDPIENYMDYSKDTCMTKFTVEQVNRIRCSIINYRWVNTPPTAVFTYTANGLDATFTNTSTDAESAATALKYKLDVRRRRRRSTDQNPVHTYAAAGTYNVTLEVLDPGCGTSTKTQTVMVTASSQPDAGTGQRCDTGSGDGPERASAVVVAVATRQDPAPSPAVAARRPAAACRRCSARSPCCSSCAVVAALARNYSDESSRATCALASGRIDVRQRRGCASRSRSTRARLRGSRTCGTSPVATRTSCTHLARPCTRSVSSGDRAAAGTADRSQTGSAFS